MAVIMAVIIDEQKEGLNAMFNFKVFGLFVVTVLICHITQGEAWAEFSLTPGVSISLEYDDNLFLEDDDEVEDLSTIIVPNISLLLRRKHLHTELNYGLEFRKYLDETYLDDDKLSDIHRGDISGELFPGSTFSILFEGSIARESVDDRRSEVAENNTANVTNRYDGLVRPRYLYRLTPRVTGELAYQYSTSRYGNTTSDDIIGSETDDIVDHDVSLLMEMEYSEKLTLQVDTYYNWHESDNFDDYEMWHCLAGFVWSPLSYLSLEAKAGGAITDVDGDKGNLKDSLYRLVLDYSQPEKLSFFTSYIKDFSTSVDDGRYKWWEVAGGVSYEDRLSGSIRTYYRENTYQFVNREDESYGVDTTIGYDLTEKIVAEFFADYSHRKYSPITEKADRYSVGFSLTRSFENSSIILRYAFNANDSDIDINDYRSNIITLSYSVQF
jgi:hypothetical protein